MTWSVKGVVRARTLAPSRAKAEAGLMDGDSGSPRIWATNPRILGPDPVWTTYPGILGPDPESGPPTLGFFWSRPVELYALRLPGGIALLNTEC